MADFSWKLIKVGTATKRKFVANTAHCRANREIPDLEIYSVEA